VLFKDVELQSTDDPIRLEASGLALQRSPAKTRVPQPCDALCADLSCRIYARRPSRCAEFECHLLQETAAGRLALEQALQVVRQAGRRADRVRRLLEQLESEPRPHEPLSVRFRRLQRRLEAAPPDGKAVEVYADLTLAMQDLNFLLSQSFHRDRA
jgi:Fe-S-cluster containining protein